MEFQIGAQNVERVDKSGGKKPFENHGKRLIKVVEKSREQGRKSNLQKKAVTKKDGGAGSWVVLEAIKSA